MPADNPSRWITILRPFDYRWPDRTALTAFSQAGEFRVKGEVADYAVARGFATEGRAKGSATRSSKGRTRRRGSARPTADASPPANPAADDGLDGTGVAADDRAEIRGAADSDAG